jgi:hypothetical protein
MADESTPGWKRPAFASPLVTFSERVRLLQRSAAARIWLLKRFWERLATVDVNHHAVAAELARRRERKTLVFLPLVQSQRIPTEIKERPEGTKIDELTFWSIQRNVWTAHMPFGYCWPILPVG